MEFYATERKKELILFAMAWLELDSIMLSEISHAVRHKYHGISQELNKQNEQASKV